ncbi:MAG: hypothetical protein WCB86_09795 [Candidatus Dormiibacterota bacterium]
MWQLFSAFHRLPGKWRGAGWFQLPTGVLGPPVAEILAQVGPAAAEV